MVMLTCGGCARRRWTAYVAYDHLSSNLEIEHGMTSADSLISYQTKPKRDLQNCFPPVKVPAENANVDAVTSKWRASGAGCVEPLMGMNGYECGMTAGCNSLGVTWYLAGRRLVMADERVLPPMQPNSNLVRRRRFSETARPSSPPATNDASLEFTPLQPQHFHPSGSPQ
jgi:hypothetical protein